MKKGGILNKMEAEKNRDPSGQMKRRTQAGARYRRIRTGSRMDQ